MSSVSNDTTDLVAEVASGMTQPSEISITESGLGSFSAGATSQRLADKNRERRFEWKWNTLLAIKSLVIFVITMGLAISSYVYHSSKSASTFRQRAEACALAGNYNDQLKWLSRYSMLVPDDRDAIVDMAIAADQAAESSDAASVGRTVDQARKQLSSSLARLGDSEPGTTTVNDLRTRLIKRLNQLGGPWYREAGRQIVLLQSPPDDAWTTHALAMALVGEVSESTYQQSLRGKESRETNYWAWLTQQKVGEVLFLAIEQNPNHLDLISKMVDLAMTNPELFSQPQQNALATDKDEDALTSEVPLDKRLEQVLSPIRNNEDSRSQLILFQADLNRGLEKEALERLQDAAASAAQRLANSEPTVSTPAGAAVEMPPAFWDFILMFEAASRTSTADAPVALGWYEQLMRTKDDSIPKNIRESLFLNAGRLHLALGDRGTALEIWRRGVDEVNPNSLDLLSSLAILLSQSESDPDRTSATLEEFRKQIATSSDLLQRMSSGEISLAQRSEIASKIEIARWRLGVLDSIAAARRDETQAAIDGFRKALESTTATDANEKIAVASQLASLYSSQGLWDKAAASLQKAVDLAPGNATLRGQTAEAWARAGNSIQAFEQWRLAGNSASPDVQLASIESMFNAQLKLAHEQRDFSGLRSKIKLLRQQVDAAPKSTDPASEQRLSNYRRRLELFEVSLPPPGISAENYFQSAAMADAVAMLSDRYVEDENVQAFAAERLAQSGRQDASMLALGRLEKIVGAPSTTSEYVRARIEATAGKTLAASERLIAQAKREIESLPTESNSSINSASKLNASETAPIPTTKSRPRAVQNLESLLMLAAEYANRANNSELAYQALITIPEDQRTFSTLFALANIAKRLPIDSTWLSNGNERISPMDLSVKWEEQLLRLEGTEGSFGLFLRATRLMEPIQNDSAGLDPDDQRLKTVRTLVRDILSRRPRWGEAISLSGSLAVIEGRRDQAVNQFRLGIASGDERFQTRQQLFEQLVALNREAEAEIELREMSLATDIEIDKYSTARIQLAQRQGDYKRSLAVAKASVQKRPDDFLSHVVLCLTATAAAAELKLTQRRDELLSLATEAIEKAETLANDSEPSIYNAKIRLASVLGDLPAMRKLIEEIELSPLDEFTKSNLTAQTFIALGDASAALPMLIRAEEIKPSAQTKIALFQLYRKLRREDDAIAALRSALSLSPQSAELRNELARTLAARDGVKVDWNELSSLLSSKDTINGNNRLLYAFLLGSQDDTLRRNQSVSILRELIKEQNSSSDDASRFLAVLLAKLASQLDPSDDSQRTDLLLETRNLYEGLVKKDAAQVADFARYAIFLVDQGEPRDLSDAEQLLRRMQSMPKGSLAALEVIIRLADKRGEKNTTPQLIRAWATQTIESGDMDKPSVSSVAGGTLLKLGFVDEGIEWFKQAYEEDPDTVGNYVVALSSAGRITESISVSENHFQKHADLMSGTLLIEALLNDVEVSKSPRYQGLVDKALARFDTQTALLESAATLRMQQGHLDNAIDLYKKVQALDPLRIRTLNNLAMALSDSPGRAIEGLAPINQALKLDEGNPELLDTKGVVLLKAGKLAEAKQVFETAIRQSVEPRYQFHLILSLLAMGDQAAAQQAWKSLDVENLDPSGLTASEQERLASLKTEFGT